MPAEKPDSRRRGLPAVIVRLASNAAGITCLTAFLAITGIFIYTHRQTQRWARLAVSPETPRASHVAYLEAILTARGLELKTEAGTVSNASSWNSNPRKTWRHDDWPPVPLMFSSMHGALAQRLGFRWQSSNVSFVAGLISNDARSTVVDLPVWFIAAIPAGPSALWLILVYLSWRRSRKPAGSGIASDPFRSSRSARNILGFSPIPVTPPVPIP